MQLANFFWILLIATGGFFIFFVFTVGYMLRKEKKANKRAATLQPAFQSPAPAPVVREYVVTQEQPVYNDIVEPQTYSSPGHTQERYARTYEDYAPQPASLRRTGQVVTNPGRTTGENQQRFVVINTTTSPDIRFR
ncbi:MAG: hypothetical protein IT279_12695 [Ignavibacteriaceae bacterium]|nr:hypothetical protein [Ignavibacteriaceae bacterium]